MEIKKVWFVTGASKGLGLTLVKRLLKEGHRVAATSRNEDDLRKMAGEPSSSFLPLQVDLANEKSVSNAIGKTIETFGHIDVLVNNAGYGQVGTLEELTDREARQNFDINVFGTLNVIRSAMPHLRKQQSGLIFNIASVGAFTGDFAGWGIYCATKFAVAGLTESLAAEIKEFGLKATVVYPGYFRTNFLATGSLSKPQNPMKEYTAARSVQQWHENEMNGNQQGDPEKAVLALIQIAEMENPPLHLFLGSDAYQTAESKLAALKDELVAFESVTKSTDY
jgi:NAD(P)-dependent dehydrogenase (short-subunit alcohol dehydrogenase family)